MFVARTGANCIREMKLIRPNDKRAMTLLELLVVFAIMVIVAGLVVGLAGVASEKGKISRAQAERDKLVMLIETYRAKVGMYPPENRQTPFRPEANSLFYELAGAVRYPGTPTIYSNVFGTVTDLELNAAFGVDGMINAITPTEDVMDVKRVLKQVKPDQLAQVFGNTRSFVVPIDGLSGKPNPWKYKVGTNSVYTTPTYKGMHNPETFDLWVEIVVRNKTNVIGNWKD